MRSVKRYVKIALLAGKFYTNNYAVVSLSGDYADGSRLNDFINARKRSLGKVMRGVG